jgi:FHS family glucose/mannose:H+ symporter-like MFS transporter
LVGYLFKNVGGEKAFYFALIPMAILIICLFILNNIQKKSNATIGFDTKGGH